MPGRLPRWILTRKARWWEPVGRHSLRFQGATAFRASLPLPQDRGLATAGEDGAPSPVLGTLRRPWAPLAQACECGTSWRPRAQSQGACNAGCGQCQGARTLPGRGAAATWAGGPSRHAGQPEGPSSSQTYPPLGPEDRRVGAGSVHLRHDFQGLPHLHLILIPR